VQDLPVLYRVASPSLRVQLTIRKHSDQSGARPTQNPSRFPQLKSALTGFLLLSAFIGVLIAAFALGSVVAIILIGIVILSLIALLVRLLFRKLKEINNRIHHD
jgi:predicted lipid-binding transport protein (Tim44 family)